MNAAEKRSAWEYIKKKSPRQESFINALRETFGDIEMVSYRVIKKPEPYGTGFSNRNVLADIGTLSKEVSCE